MYRSRTGRLLRSTFLMILISLPATGCESFTLVGKINIGADGMADENDERESIQNEEAVCWPSAAAAFAEMVAHGFTPKKWPAVEDWFRRLEAVKKSLPVCE